MKFGKLNMIRALRARAIQTAKVARSELLDIARGAPPSRWSHTVGDYYPVAPTPRWGYGVPPNPYFLRVLEEGRSTYNAALTEFEKHRALLHSIPRTAPAGSIEPCWDNEWFSVLDAASLVGFLTSRNPKRYLEIGCGASTTFARYSIEAGSLRSTVISIDPQPRREIDRLCDQMIRKPLESCNLDIFDQLESGDILFFDGSHRVFQNSDTTTFFIDIIPRLKPGILIHVHDIFLPDDYPPEWKGRLYSEQYLLGAMLLCRGAPFRVVLPNYFVCRDSILQYRVRELFQSTHGGQGIPFFYYNKDDGIPGVSFWVETSPGRRP